jgi:hypothetical protein
MEQEATEMDVSTTVSVTRQAIMKSRNGRGRHIAPVRSKPVQVDDADARYDAALRLVQAIDRDLQKGTRHYYDATGKLLVSLDEVVQAILNDNLVVDRPPRFTRDHDLVTWPVVGELVA